MVTTSALALMDYLINRHSTLNVLCRDMAILILFADFIKICAEEGLFSHHTDWKSQNYCTKNKFIQRRNGELSLSVSDIKYAEVLIAQHVQRSVLGKICTKLAKAVSQLRNTQLKCKMKKLANLKLFLNSCGLLRICERLSKTNIDYKQKHQIILP